MMAELLRIISSCSTAECAYSEGTHPVCTIGTLSCVRKFLPPSACIVYTNGADIHTVHQRHFWCNTGLVEQSKQQTTRQIEECTHSSVHKLQQTTLYSPIYDTKKYPSLQPSIQLVNTLYALLAVSFVLCGVTMVWIISSPSWQHTDEQEPTGISLFAQSHTPTS